MKLYISVILLFISYCSCSGYFRSELFTAMPGCSEDVILPVTPVNSDFVSSRGQCLANCLGDSRCVSVNLCEDPQSGQVCHRLPETSNGSCSNLQAAVWCVHLEPANVCQHGGTFNDALSKCDCYDDYTGTYCERRYTDCTEAFEGGMRAVTSNNRHVIIRPLNAPRDYLVECLLSNGGYTILETRPSTCNDYNKTWAEYKTGWDTSCSRWLGLEALHYISHQGNCTLGIYVKGAGGLVGLFYYRGFRVDDDASGYKLSFGNSFKHPTSAVGNGFEYGVAGKGINGQRFATWDRPDPSGCAVLDGAGWWYGTDCPDTNLHKSFFMVKWPDDSGVIRIVWSLNIQIRVIRP
ncbi:fibrinogen-like protein 1 [Haliotis cracherodii]|uniref:fibrinogen-like protein 1 n=1 Tax=Haliotis cracherodii TaxID=6455 RepID=UPI0039EBE918